MRKWFIFFLVFISCSFSLLAQVTGPEQDCPFALPVCQTIFQQPQTYVRIGQIDDIPDSSSCLTNEETNSVWYIFTVEQSGNLEMSIIPLQPDDYDFAIYNVSDTNCNAITLGRMPPVRCNYSSFFPTAPPPNNNPITGMKDGFDSVIARVPDPNFIAPLQVVAGETYVLIVDNFFGGGGYTLDFTTNMANPASIFDQTPPFMVNVNDLGCDASQTLRVSFSEKVECASIEPGGSQFELIGPGNINIIGASGVRCDSSAFTTEIILLIDPNSVIIGGNYTLRAKLGVGNTSVTDFCKNPVDKNITLLLTAPDIVTADFDFLIQSGCVADTFVFTDQSIGNVQSWLWDFGDNSPTVNTPNALHSFPDTTNFNVTLIVSAGQCADTATQTVDVMSNSSISFTTSKVQACIGDSIIFTNNTPPSANTNYLWTFSDGTIAGTRDVSKVFSTSGVFTISLIVSDATVPNCIDTVSQSIIINDLPIADFISITQPLCANSPSLFVDNSTGNISSRVWNFNNTNFSSDSIGVVVFSNAGSASVSLTVVDAFCGQDSITKFFDVNAQPIFDLGEDTAICFSENILFAAPAGFDTYRWSTGETTQFINFGEVPNEVSLTVTESGCSNFDAVFVDEIIEDCFFVKVPAAFSPNGDQLHDFLKIFTLRVASFELKIFNRWGEMVFSTVDENILWDGRHSGDMQDIEVFSYSVEGLAINGQRFFNSGTITLLR